MLKFSIAKSEKKGGIFWQRPPEKRRSSLSVSPSGWRLKLIRRSSTEYYNSARRSNIKVLGGGGVEKNRWKKSSSLVGKALLFDALEITAKKKIYTLWHQGRFLCWEIGSFLNFEYVSERICVFIIILCYVLNYCRGFLWMCSQWFWQQFRSHLTGTVSLEGFIKRTYVRTYVFRSDSTVKYWICDYVYVRTCIINIYINIRNLY